MKRKLALAALVSLSSSVSLANTIPEVGYFTRTYSADHLASSSLREGTGQSTVYRLNAASAGSCEGMY